MILRKQLLDPEETGIPDQPLILQHLPHFFGRIPVGDRNADDPSLSGLHRLLRKHAEAVVICGRRSSDHIGDDKNERHQFNNRFHYRSNNVLYLHALILTNPSAPLFEIDLRRQQDIHLLHHPAECKLGPQEIIHHRILTKLPVFPFKRFHLIEQLCTVHAVLYIKILLPVLIHLIVQLRLFL